MMIDAHEITRGLWQGSAPPQGRTLMLAGFDVLVLAAMEIQPPPQAYPDIDIARIALDDEKLTYAQLCEALVLSSRIARAISGGAKVLVTCAQGRNRSGLISALVLMRLRGCNGLEAIRMIRIKRMSPFGKAMTNNSYNDALTQIPKGGILVNRESSLREIILR
jgi:Dual specificity phosphatase, catalytic domain